MLAVASEDLTWLLAGLLTCCWLETLLPLGRWPLTSLAVREGDGKDKSWSL